MTLLSDLQPAVAAIAERVGPAVVGLGRGWGSGSGVVVADGLVLTSAHNLRRESPGVVFADGRRADATVSGADPDADVAVLAVDTAGIPPVEWADGAAALGTPVFAVANPGGRGLRVTFGLVSAERRSFRGPRGRRAGGAIEHTAPVVRGSSGSPLVDVDGRLLGLNTLRLEGGVILAVAATNDLRERTDRLARGDAQPTVRLGVAVAPPRAARRMRRAVGLPELDGLLVRGVDDDSPAARAGLERGDLIVSAGGTEIERIDDLFAALDDAAAAGTLALRVVRGTDAREVAVPLADAS